jgi:iron-sulfur cluster assembly protein
MDNKQPISITENAAAQINGLLAQAPAGTKGVRLTIKPKGCSGNSYQMEYVAEGESIAGDDVFESAGAALYIPKTHSWMLFGMVVDYTVDELGSARFEFLNPNETGRCGCGESFHVDVDELRRRQDQPPAG